MKRLLALVLASALIPAAWAAVDPAPVGDRSIGRLPDGTAYFTDEVLFCLKAERAQALSPTGVGRRAVSAATLANLDPAILAVVANHLTAARWLQGEALPPAIKSSPPEVPAIARSLTAQLRQGEDAARIVEQLRAHPDIEWASLNTLHPPINTPNDTRWGEQWGPPRVRADDAWDVSQASTSLRVAVIDTGVDLLHPDLVPWIVYNRGFGGNTSGDAHRDRRGGASIDHGTHVAGIAAAIRDNSRGVAGIVRAQIMALGCASWQSSASEYWICCAADAINDAVANSADAINCSFGNASLSAAVNSALDNASNNGVLVVCASGNDGTNIIYSGSAGWAAHAWPLIVGNTQQDDTRRPSSNYGDRIDLAAPGTDILSTVTTNYTAASTNGTYGNMSGTSMASPCVMGGVVLTKSLNPTRITGAGLKHLLHRMAEDLGPAGEDTSFGAGLLQLDPAFLRVLRNAHTFVGFNLIPFVANGTYQLPYTTVADGIIHNPPGGTIVLNGGVGGTTFNYPAQNIATPCTLTAFPDHPVTIGQ
jgi:subtilisin family serine protease